MDTLTLKILFMIGVVSSFVIRFPYQRENKQNTIVRDRKTNQEKILLLLVFIGMIILPLIYVLSPWLNLANYSLPAWANWLWALSLLPLRCGYSGALIKILGKTGRRP